MNQENIPINPITGWEIKTAPSLEIILFQPTFISHALQKMEEQQTAPCFALTAQQVRELVSTLSAALQKIDTAEPQQDSCPRH
ncbi:MAG: hypothetical protein LBI35_04460 [Burkholderiales bacterium]|jgi:hypothetical protein|nr:hypothetical protein [Burkholderiales bacterium]